MHFRCGHCSKEAPGGSFHWAAVGNVDKTVTLNEGEQEPGPFDITQTSTGKGQVKNEIMYCTKFHHCAKCSIKPHQLLTNQTALGVCKLFAGHNEASKVQILVSWCFEPSQPQRIISGLKTNFNLSRSYSFHGLLYPKSPFLKPQLKLYPQFQNTNPEKQ